MTGPTDTIARAEHRARVATVVALGLDGQLYDSHDGMALEVADALESLGVRPPARYGPADGALVRYAIELVEVAERLAAYRIDPASAYADEHDVDTLAVTLDQAATAEQDRIDDRLEELLGESYRADARPPLR